MFLRKLRRIKTKGAFVERLTSSVNSIILQCFSTSYCKGALYYGWYHNWLRNRWSIFEAWTRFKVLVCLCSVIVVHTNCDSGQLTNWKMTYKHVSVWLSFLFLKWNYNITSNYSSKSCRTLPIDIVQHKLLSNFLRSFLPISLL